MYIQYVHPRVGGVGYVHTASTHTLEQGQLDMYIQYVHPRVGAVGYVHTVHPRVGAVGYVHTVRTP